MRPEMNATELVRRVFLRFAYSRDPKVVSKEFEKLHAALEHLQHAKGDLDDGANYHAYITAIDAYRDVKFFLEHMGAEVEHETPALLTMSKNPFNPAQAVKENKSVFKEAIAEVGTLEKAFAQAHSKAAA